MNLIRVGIQGLEPGIRLGEDIVSSKGILLAKKDQFLDKKLIQVLKSFAVTEVVVVSSGESIEKNLSHFDLQIVAEIKLRFKNLDLKKAMIQKLFEHCVHRQTILRSQKSGDR